MNDATLKRFRELAEGLSERKKFDCKIVIKTTDKIEMEVPAVYNPMFETMTFCRLTVPVKEVPIYIPAVFGEGSTKMKNGISIDGCGSGSYGKWHFQGGV